MAKKRMSAFEKSERRRKHKQLHKWIHININLEINKLEDDFYYGLKCGYDVDDESMKRVTATNTKFH